MSLVEERGISSIPIKEEMDTSYLDYAMSVIIGRALPDVRDGLKPVHRRVLYAMFREGLLHNRKFSKCAGVVGEVLKKYHPHGDGAVYDTLVRMAQPWNLRYPLVQGQGNFGSIDGDSAAAYRYTESRMTHLAEMMLQDIDKDTVDFVENFDGSTVEPLVLPTLFPALLVNGTDGIAVGMATKIPPHNLREVINSCIHLLYYPETTVHELVHGGSHENGDFGPLIQGPDFPTGGKIMGRQSILDAYSTGRSIIRMRGTCQIEEDEGSGRASIIITEIPYQVNKARLVEKIAELVRDRKIEGIRPGGLRDETNRKGLRIVIELKRDAHPEVVLNQLYKHSPLQSSFGVIMLSIVEGKPKLLPLKDMLGLFLQHRKEVTTRRCRFELKKAEARAHILEGLVKALENIDDVIQTIRSHRSAAEAKIALCEKFEFSEEQAKAILEMRLQKLTGMEHEELQKELDQLRSEIQRLRDILGQPELLREVIAGELEKVRDLFGDERRSEIQEVRGTLSMEDVIADEDMVVTLSSTGYIKRTLLADYKAQRRGGKGVQGVSTHDKDFVTEMFVASAHENLLIFTSKGRLLMMKVFEIPQTSKTSKGRPLVNMIKLEEGEMPKTIKSLREFEEDKFVFFATKHGVVKKTPLMAFKNYRSSGLRAIALADDDELIGVDITDGNRNILLGTRQELAIRFQETDVRPMGRTARGVRGIRLDEGNEVVSLVVTDDEHDILTVTENGFGKRTPITDYRITKRGGKGIFSIQRSERNGKIASIVDVTDSDQLMFSTDQGKMIRIRCSDIRSQGRTTQGSRLFRVSDHEHVTSVARIAEDGDEENELGEVTTTEANQEPSNETSETETNPNTDADVSV